MIHISKDLVSSLQPKEKKLQTTLKTLSQIAKFAPAVFRDNKEKIFPFVEKLLTKNVSLMSTVVFNLQRTNPKKKDVLSPEGQCKVNTFSQF